MDAFIKKLEIIIKQLDELDGLIDGIAQSYCGNDFEEQNVLAANIENLMLAATHETASNLSFLKQNIQDVVCYIAFRKKYNFLSEEELEQIIDNDSLRMDFKMMLQHKTDSCGYAALIKSVQDDWRGQFHYISFGKLKKIINAE